MIFLLIYLIISHVKHHFMDLLAIGTFLWRNVYTGSLPIFEGDCLDFVVLNSLGLLNEDNNILEII